MIYVEKVSYKTKDKRIDSALCKRTRNIDTYSELIGGYRVMDETHIANGDVDFDGVLKLEPHEKESIVITSKAINNVNMFHCWDNL